MEINLKSTFQQFLPYFMCSMVVKRPRTSHGPAVKTLSSSVGPASTRQRRSYVVCHPWNNVWPMLGQCSPDGCKTASDLPWSGGRYNLLNLGPVLARLPWTGVTYNAGLRRTGVEPTYFGYLGKYSLAGRIAPWDTAHCTWDTAHCTLGYSTLHPGIHTSLCVVTQIYTVTCIVYVVLLVSV